MKRRRNVRRRNGTAPSCPAPNRRRRNGGAEMALPRQRASGTGRPNHLKSRAHVTAEGAPSADRNYHLFIYIAISIYKSCINKIKCGKLNSV